MNNSNDLKARANAAFTSQPAAHPAASTVDQDADTVHAKIARLKALREAREKANADRTEKAKLKARRYRGATLKP